MKPKIPKGYRRLKRGEIIRLSDKYWSYGEGPWTKESVSSPSQVGQHYQPPTSKAQTCHHAYIRKVTRK